MRLVIIISKNISQILKSINTILLFLRASLRTFVANSQNHSFQIPTIYISLNQMLICDPPSIFLQILITLYLYTDFIFITIKFPNYNKRCVIIQSIIYNISIMIVFFIVFQLNHSILMSFLKYLNNLAFINCFTADTLFLSV